MSERRCERAEGCFGVGCNKDGLRSIGWNHFGSICALAHLASGDDAKQHQHDYQDLKFLFVGFHWFAQGVYSTLIE